MAASTGIVLSAAGIAFVNDWYQTNDIPWRIGVAGLLLAAFMGGVEKIPDAQPFAVGLSAIALVTVLVTPISGRNSPLQSLSNVVNTPAKA
jgi:hypothetical protein